MATTPASLPPRPNYTSGQIIGSAAHNAEFNRRHDKINEIIASFGDLNAEVAANTAAISNLGTAAKHRLLLANNAANPTFQVDVDAELLGLNNAADEWLAAANVDLTIDISSTGANGLESDAAEAASTWYSVWVISNGTSVAGLLSDDTAVPSALPSGYTWYRRVGWVYNDASQDFLLFWHTYDSDFIEVDPESAGYFAITPTLAAQDLDISSGNANRATLGSIPPTSTRAFITGYATSSEIGAAANTNYSWLLYMRPNGAANGSPRAYISYFSDAGANTHFVAEALGFDVHTDADGLVEYFYFAPVNDTSTHYVSVRVGGYYDPT